MNNSNSTWWYPPVLNSLCLVWYAGQAKKSASHQLKLASSRYGVRNSAMKLIGLISILMTLPTHADVNVHFINVGQGDGILIQCPAIGTQTDETSPRILIDFGAKGKPAYGAAIDPNDPNNPISTARKRELDTANVLWNLGQAWPKGSDGSASGDRELKHLVITHGDGDHYNLVSHLLNKGVGLIQPSFGPSNSVMANYAKVKINHAFVSGGDQDWRGTGFVRPYHGNVATLEGIAINGFYDENKQHASLVKIEPNAQIDKAGFAENGWNQVIWCPGTSSSHSSRGVGASGERLEFRLVAANVDPHTAAQAKDLNGRSAVVLLRHTSLPDPATGKPHVTHLWLTGDATEKTENWIRQIYPNYNDEINAFGVPDAIMLKVAHHGADHSTTASWLDWLPIKLEKVFVSADSRQSHKHPYAEVLTRLKTRMASGSEPPIPCGEKTIIGFNPTKSNSKAMIKKKSKQKPTQIIEKRLRVQCHSRVENTDRILNADHVINPYQLLTLPAQHPNVASTAQASAQTTTNVH